MADKTNFLTLFKQCEVLSIDDTVFPKKSFTLGEDNSIFALKKTLHFSASAVEQAERVEEGYWMIKEQRGGCCYIRFFTLSEIT